MKTYRAFLIPIIMIFLFSCKKEPGQVVGVVMKNVYDNDFKVFQYRVPAADIDVYLCNAETLVIDRVKTSNSGAYYFDKVEDGQYQIIVYSDDTSHVYPMVSKSSSFINVSVGEVVSVDTLDIFKGIGIEKGNATITGKIWLINYKSNGYDIKDISLAQELDVYLIYEDHATFDVRTRTNYDGVFQFKNLIKGKYTVYVYSEQEDALGNLTNATEKVARKKIIYITSDKQEVFVTDTVKAF